jgi:hypothetical protein
MEFMLVCVFIVFSLHRESPNLILRDEPLILRWFYHTWPFMDPIIVELTAVDPASSMD